jgi:hypothetical protein
MTESMQRVPLQEHSPRGGSVKRSISGQPPRCATTTTTTSASSEDAGLE